MRAAGWKPYCVERDRLRSFHTFQPFTRLQVLELRERLAAFLAGRR